MPHVLYEPDTLARVSDRLSDATGLGEAFFGAALLGGSTSLPGIVTSVTAAASGHPQMAISNAVGGIAAQTALVALADIAHRRANLEHAAASVENLINATTLCALLGLVLLAAAGPQWTWLGLHPASIMLLGGYAFGLKLATHTHRSPGWQPVNTRETCTDQPDTRDIRSANLALLWGQFTLAAIVVGTAGYLIGISGIVMVRSTGLSESLIGGLLTTIAAVRQGALTLAVGVIISGNTFDVLFIAFSDAAYREGSIYHTITAEPRFVISLTIVLTSILLLGLIRREKNGPGNIGFEGMLVLAFYLGGFFLLTLGLAG